VAFDRERTAVKHHQLRCEREAESRPFAMPRKRILNLLKRLERLFDFLYSHTHAGVRDGESESAIGLKRMAEPDGAAFRSEFYGIGKYIEENLLQRSLIGMERDG
jgi:hypothetical protein